MMTGLKRCPKFDECSKIEGMQGYRFYNHCQKCKDPIRPGRKDGVIHGVPSLLNDCTACAYKSLCANVRPDCFVEKEKDNVL